MKCRSLIAFVLVFSQLPLTPFAGAAQLHAVSWGGELDLDWQRVMHAEYVSPENLLNPVVSHALYEDTLNDKAHRMSREFQIPKELRATVQFWLRIYTEFTTQHVILFDSEHPNITYEVLDFRELAKSARNRVVYEILVKRKVKSILAKYRQAFTRLARAKKPKLMTREEAIILSALNQSRHRHSFSYYARHLRSQTGQRDNIVRGLLSAENYFQRMERIFLGLGLPPELIRLTLVESSFNLSVLSRKEAAGIWQFIPVSGKEYLLIDPKHRIDERLSPLKSTVAAGKLLRRNYRLLGNWISAVTAYNHGFRGLPRHLGPGTEEFRGFVQKYCSCNRKARLGWASKNYYSEFLAVLYAEKYRENFYGALPSQDLRPLVFKRLTKKQNLLGLAMEYGISLQEFRRINPDVKDFRLPLPAGFRVAVPAESDDLRSLMLTAHR